MLQIGVLGAGPISQSAHLDACRKARNAQLYALCDVAPDLLARLAAVHAPRVVYSDFAAMLADPQVEAVIVAVADQYHVPLCLQALEAGKHVLVEKPLGITVEECLALRDRCQASGLVLQVGHNRRFDPGVAFAKRFVTDELGAMLSFKAWYHDSTLRYTMTDNLQPVPIRSLEARQPDGDPRADRRRYYMLAHGSHLVDMARCLAGDILSVRGRLIERAAAYCWFVDVEFASGSLGHLDLHVPLRGDFGEGFEIAGEMGSVKGRLYLPWYHKAGEVECFSVRDRQYRRLLGEDAYTYRLQIEGFAETILHGGAQQGADVEDGLAAMRAMVAVARSVESGERVALADVSGGL